MKNSLLFLLAGFILSSCAGSAGRNPASKRLTQEKEQAEYEAGLSEWLSLRAGQVKACSPALDSRDLLRGHKTQLAVIILHGFSQNPERVQHLIDFFAPYDINVLAPRLAYHFDENLSDLDKAHAADWAKQTDNIYKTATKLGYGVVVMGYSLGGLLATRLALANPDTTMAAVLLSPAWRVTPLVDEATNVGWLFGVDGNKILKSEAACDSEKPYLSAPAGAEVDQLAANVERVFDGNYPGTSGSAIMRMTAETPTFLAIMDQDQVVDSDKARQILIPAENGFRTLLVYSGKDHGTLIDPKAGKLSFMKKESHTPYASENLMDQIGEFLRDKASLQPRSSP